MNGCVYRTKDNECDLWTDEKHKSFCDPDCKDKHPSNADRIRAMTDEELAEFLNDVAGDYCSPLIGKCLADNCKDCLMKWLKQEVAE